MRAMAVVRWIIFAAMALVAVGTWYVFELREEPAAHGPDRFYCPMHPQIRSHDPGTCPICFMKLEPIPEERGATAPPASPSASASVQPSPGVTPPGTRQVMLTTERQQTVGIAVTEADERSLSRELRFSAAVDSPQRAMSEVRVRTDAFVEQVNPAEAGQTVKAGEPMVWIHSADLIRAQNELLLAASSPMIHSAADSQPPSAESPLVEAARDRLGLLGMHKADIDAVLKSGKPKRLVPVRALSSGVVAEKRAVMGSVASPQDLLFRIVDLEKTWVVATVPNEELALVRGGLAGVFQTQSGAGKLEVEASVVEPAVAAETRTARVRFVVKKKGEALPLPGEIGTVVVSLPEAPYVVVPRDAVIDTGEARYVFIELSPGVFEPRTVRTGALLGEQRAIEAGVNKGERVVARGAFVLDSESRLQAALAPAAPASASASHSGHP
jgi:hypothetical protein